MTWISNKREKRHNRIVIIVFVIFVALGCWIVIDAKFNVKRMTVEEAVELVDARIHDYIELVDTSPEVVRIAEAIKNITENEYEQHQEVYRFMVINISYRSDSDEENLNNINNEPLYTLEHGGDCENKAVLALSIIKALGNNNTYLIYQPKHICWGAWIGYDFKLYNCIPGETILRVRRV